MGIAAPPPTNSNDIGYTGHHHNDEIGLIYMNARYYLPGVGRFISADSLIPSPANPQSLNRYSYVGNNPINGVDPDGHCYPVCTAIIGGVLGGTLTGLTYYLTTPAADRNWGDALTAVGAGVVGGALIGTGVGAGAGIATIAAVGGGTGIVVSAEAYMITNKATDTSFDTSDFLVASGVGSVEGAVAPFTGAGSILVSGVASGLQPALSNVFNGDKIDYRSVASGTVAGLFSGVIGYQVSKIDIGEWFTPSFARPISKSVSTFNSLPYPITDPIVSRLGSLTLPTKPATFLRTVLRGFASGVSTEVTEGDMQNNIINLSKFIK